MSLFKAGDSSAVASWFLLSFFGLFWVFPVFWTGFLRRSSPLPSIPRTERMTNAFCLFATSQDYVPLQYVQVLLPGAAAWATESDHHYLRMTPFGERTRFDEMLRKRLANGQSLAELAAFVRRRHEARTGTAPIAVRFVTGVSLPEPRPRGRFVKPRLEDIHPIRRSVWYVQAYAPIPRELALQWP